MLPILKVTSTEAQSSVAFFAAHVLVILIGHVEVQILSRPAILLQMWVTNGL